MPEACPIPCPAEPRFILFLKSTEDPDQLDSDEAI